VDSSFCQTYKFRILRTARNTGPQEPQKVVFEGSLVVTKASRLDGMNIWLRDSVNNAGCFSHPAISNPKKQIFLSSRLAQ
jgi:hypothetical protein